MQVRAGILTGLLPTVVIAVKFQMEVLLPAVYSEFISSLPQGPDISSY